jgi:hypothetical protein
LVRGDEGLDLVEVRGPAEREIVESDDTLVEAKQGLDQVRADEARPARYDPLPRRLAEGGLHVVESSHRIRFSTRAREPIAER